MSVLSSERLRGLSVAVLFLALALLLTWPIPREIASAVPGFGDSLLNAWILAWEGRAIGSLDLAGFFDTNIFHPLEGTLTYSELMLPQAIFATPAWLATGNPVLVFNLVLLASIWTTALATYLLAMHLTRDRAASFVAGAIFAFSPFMFAHLPQVQTLFAAGIPLAFLFLHRFAESGATRDLVLFGAVFAVQALGNGYYAVYLALFGGLFLLFHAVRGRLLLRPRFWAQAALVAVIVAAVVGPVYLSYTEVAAESGFTRPTGPPTGLASFLSTPASNRLYGGVALEPGAPGARLFPGVVAALLAAFGLAAGVRRGPAPAESAEGRSGPRPPGGRRAQRTLLVLELAIAAVAVAILAIDLGGGFAAELGGLSLRATGIGRPLLLLGALVLARWLARRRWPGCRSLFPHFTRPTYPALLAAAFVLALGTQPYALLRDHLPGFGNLRAPYRIGVVFLFALAVLAAEGSAKILARLRGRRRTMAAVVLPALVLVECLSVPVPLTAVPSREEMPAVHRWLAERGGDPVLAFLPARIPLEHERVLYSAYHWRRMVNGFSGYAPYLYVELAERSRELPTRELLDDLGELGVDLLLVETDHYRRGRRKQVLRRLERLGAAADGPLLVGDFEGVRVYELPGAEDPAALGPPTVVRAASAPIDRSGWRLRAEPAAGIESTVDGDPESCWTAPMRGTSRLELDLGARRRVGAIVLTTGASPLGYPRGYRVEASPNGRTWRTVAEERRFHPPLAAFVEPLELRVEIPLPATSARHLRIVLERTRAELSWVVCELELFAPRKRAARRQR